LYSAIIPGTKTRFRGAMCLSSIFFIQICAVGSKRRIFSATECVLAVQGHSRSSKVDDFGTNWKRVCHFLL